MLSELHQLFTGLGATFFSPVEEIEEKLNPIKAFVFDWDGVFNDGAKTMISGSSFTETDSMGTNLLRFGFWLRNNCELPTTAILTGAQNETAAYFARREHFDDIILNAKNKLVAFEYFKNSHGLEKEEIAFVFDDVLDISVAKTTGLNFVVRQAASPLFAKYLCDNKIGDYGTAGLGGKGALREICELILGIYGNYDQVLDKRIAFSEDYQKYWNQRNSVETKVIQL